MKRLMLSLAAVALTLVSGNLAQAGWGDCHDCHTSLWSKMTGWIHCRSGCHGHLGGHGLFKGHGCNDGCPPQYGCKDQNCSKGFWSRHFKDEEQARLQQFWSDYNRAMEHHQNCRQLMQNLDWECYYKSQGMHMPGHGYGPYGGPSQMWHSQIRSPRDFFMDP